jgi:rod shape-determining protein MreD
MNEFSERLLSDASRKDKARFRPLILIVVPLAAILFQVYVPRFLPFLSYLELPLLITVHFALSRREPISSLLYGAVIGLIQDSLSNQKIGMYGIVKTLVGYSAASVGLRLDVDNRVSPSFWVSSFTVFTSFFIGS